MNVRNKAFDRSKHVFKSKVFDEVIKDSIRFFNGTPVHKLPPPENFKGAGVYALFYIGKSPYYKPLYEANRMGFVQPIYVGKAVPRGWRQARAGSDDRNELYQRLCDHAKSITEANNLNLSDFYCRFVIMEGSARDLIATLEASLIRYFSPVWNSVLDGFGNHDPGKGRYNQARSDWDILHPGRHWADKCSGTGTPMSKIKNNLSEYFGK